ncbi:MAG: tetratricopeptide repeat protein [Kiritimatiellaeota bacterium]|nr:tetratricopeptide repeat protein [Kiritimatiellota bacterium]
MRLLKYATTCMCVALAAGVCCAAEKDDKAKPPKGKKPNVLALMKPADELINNAQDAHTEGDTKKAVEFYRQALESLTKIEEEHYAWVATTEFHPLRFRKVFCETRIESILLDDAKTFSRMIVVTDTQELEQKRAERLKKAAGEAPEEATPRKLGIKDGVAPSDAFDDIEGDAGGPVQISEEMDWAKDMLLIDQFDDAEQALLKVLRVDRENRQAQFLMALSRVRQGKNTDALVILDGLLEDDAKDESALLLAAGAYMATGAYSKAVNALDRAMKANPKRPDACLNMAWLLLEMRPEDTSEAEAYYRQAVKMGTSRVRDLEKRLGIKQE